MNRTIDSAIFLAICTAILYSWSTANYQGYLSVLGLDADMMERSFHQVIYSGLLVSFVPILSGIFLISCMFLIYAHTLLPAYVDYVRSGVKAKRKIIKLQNFFLGKRKSPVIEVNAKKIFNKSAVILIFSIFFILSLLYAESEGKQRANYLIKPKLKDAGNEKRVITVELNNKQKKLLYIACGSKNCAGIELKTNKVYYFPQSSGYMYLYEKM